MKARLTALIGLAVAGLLHAAEPVEAPLLADAEVLARAPALSLEERRYLVYLYARLEKPGVAEQLAEPLLAANPGDRQTLLVLASMHLERKDASATLRIARRFLAAHPDDPQGLYFLGVGHHLAQNYAESNRILSELQRTQFPNQKFPYETDLAASAYAAGDWRRAMLAYQRLLQDHDLGDESRDEVRRALDGIYREHNPRVEGSASLVHLDRAEVWRTGGAHGRHITDRQFLELRYGRDDVALDAAPGLSDTRRIREEFSAHHAMLHDGRWRTDAWLGHSGEGAFGGARANHTFARQREVALELAANVRGTESLTLEALDGRQNHVAVILNWLIEADLSLTIRAHVRQLRLAGESLGRGSGVDLNLDYALRQQGPRVVVGYRGSVSSFSSDAAFNPIAVAPIADPAGGVATQQAIVANLVSRRINRHGTGLLVTDNLADAWIYRLTAGVDYDFELSSTAWNGSLGLTFFPRKNIELTAEVGYTSSASASNAGSAAKLFNVFARFHY